jgi:WD40 repeat protein
MHLCRVWDIDTLDCVRVLEGHNEAVLALAVGPSFLVSGSYDTTVRFWALDTLRCVRWRPSPNARLFINALLFLVMCQCTRP